MPDDVEYLNIQQAADAIGTNRRRVWQLVKEGKLTTIENPLDRRERVISKGQIDRMAKFSKKAAA
jgi:hypothetical protein